MYSLGITKVTNDFRGIAKAIRLARATTRNIRQGLALALPCNRYIRHFGTTG